MWGRYGFCDAFNPATGWIGPDVLGIDQDVTLLSAVRTGNVWRWFMANLDLCRFHRRSERVQTEARQFLPVNRKKS